MFFDLHLWSTAFLWALLNATFFGILALFPRKAKATEGNRSRSDGGPKAKWWRSQWKAAVITAFVVELVQALWKLYFTMPAFVGSLGGYHSFFVTVFFTSIAVFGIRFLLSNKTHWPSQVATIVVLLLLVAVVPLLQHFASGTGLEQVRLFAALPNVKIVDGTAMPPTDPAHIVMVDQDIAAFKGSSVIASSGDNLGSIFQTNKEDYVLQSVAQHLYWIAPLDYSNMRNQVGWFAQKFETSPGYVAVDAEDINAPAILHLKNQNGSPLAIKYLPDAVFDQNLERHIYQAGYTNGELEDPTMEVDDNWRPFYTVTYIVPASGVSGQRIEKVLLVDAQNGAITEYAPDHVPAWIDRVMSENLVNEYANYWGLYGDHQHNQYWFDNEQFQSHAVDMSMHYSLDGKPIWVMSFSSLNAKDASATGIMVVDTHDNKWTFYKGFQGQPVGRPISAAFESFPNSPRNINQYTVGTPQLYSIDGHPTWVTIYTRANGVGSSFAAIAFLDALNPQPENVIYGETRDEVVTNYRSYLANHGHNINIVGTKGSAHKPVTGSIFRIGQSQVSGVWMYSFTIIGDQHIFQIASDKHPELPLVQPGDAVTFDYLDTQQNVQAVGKFTDEAVFNKAPRK